MKIATARQKTSKRWRTQEITWQQFLDRLREPLRTGETMREYKAMGKADKDRAKEAAGGFVGGALDGGQRKTEFVRERWLLTLDADKAKAGAWEQAAALVEYRMACYSTHSHTPEAPRLRWILPVDRAMTPDEYPAVARKVAQWLDIETMDPTTYEVARLMYWPTCAKDGEYLFMEQDGPVLSVDAVLREYGDGDAWKDTTLWPVARAEQEIRQRAQQQAGDPLEKPGMVGLFCRTYDVEDAIADFLGDIYAPTDVPGRYTYIGGSTTGGAIVYNQGRFLYSNHATDPCQGMSVNAFDLVRIHKFGHLDTECEEGTAVTKLPSYSSMAKWAAELPEIRAASTEERLEAVNRDFADLAEAQAVEEQEQETQKKDWKSQLTLDEKTGGIEETIHNAVLLLRNLPDFAGKLGYNPMSDTITVKGDLPWWGKKSQDRLDRLFDEGEGENIGKDEEPLGAWEEVDWSSLYAYFEGLGFPTRGKTNGVLDHAVQIVTKENSFHPIRSYLKGLKWDGVARLETMFIRWLGAEDTKLNREITLLWMLAGVDRVMRPGCQFDSVLITCGPQGIGKTRMLRQLAKGFFTNSVDKLSVSKDTGEKLQGVWIVELGELDGMKRGEVTTTKNFLTTTVDRYRSAYARAAVDHPRQCIFAGTSNEASFLRDSTGERRFWIMPVEGAGDQGRLVGFSEEVDQIWAEAMARWAGRMRACRIPGQPWEAVDLNLYIQDQALQKDMLRVQAGYKAPEEDRESVEDYLDELRPANWYDLDLSTRRDFAQDIWIGDKETCTLRVDRISVKELRCELFGERLDDAGRKSSRSYRLTDIMDTVPGWRKAGKQRIKGYRGATQTWVRIGSEDDKKLKGEQNDEGTVH